MTEWNPNLPEVTNLPKVNKPKKYKRPPKKRGRKKLIRPFELVAFGRSLLLHAPLEYDMIMMATGGEAPSPDFVEEIGYSSLNPYFRSPIFRRLLIQYRKNGCTQEEPSKPPTPEMKLRAMQRRRRRMYDW